jgi:hypothetical protein
MGGNIDVEERLDASASIKQARFSNARHIPFYGRHCPPMWQALQARALDEFA